MSEELKLARNVMLFIAGAAAGFAGVSYLRRSAPQPAIKAQAIELLPLGDRAAAPAPSATAAAPAPEDLSQFPFGGQRLSWWAEAFRRLDRQPDGEYRALLESRARANGLVISTNSLGETVVALSPELEAKIQRRRAR